MTYRYNDEDDKFEWAAFVANSKEEYSEKLKEAVQRCNENGIKELCLQKARENSSEVRADKFFQAISY